jgi:hypothetical protein
MSTIEGKERLDGCAKVRSSSEKKLRSSHSPDGDEFGGAAGVALFKPKWGKVGFRQARWFSTRKEWLGSKERCACFHCAHWCGVAVGRRWARSGAMAMEENHRCVRGMNGHKAMARWGGDKRSVLVLECALACTHVALVSRGGRGTG